MRLNTLKWLRNGEQIPSPEGYNVYDFYPGIEDWRTAERGALDAAYRGPDCDGIEAIITCWSLDKGQPRSGVAKLVPAPHGAWQVVLDPEAESSDNVLLLPPGEILTDREIDIPSGISIIGARESSKFGPDGEGIEAITRERQA